MKKKIRLTESDLMRLVKKVISEQNMNNGDPNECYRWGEIYVCVGERNEGIKRMQKELNEPPCCGDCVPIKENGIFGKETKDRLLFTKKTCQKGVDLRRHVREEINGKLHYTPYSNAV